MSSHAVPLGVDPRERDPAPGALGAGSGADLSTEFEVRALDDFLARAEQEVRLLDRVRPRNAARELERVKQSFRMGQPCSPKYAALAPAQLGPLRKILDQLASRLDGAGPWGALYAARARELELEAAVADALGTSELRARVAARFPVTNDLAGRQAMVWANAWLEEPGASDEPQFHSDDVRSPRSLLRQLQTDLRRRDLPVRLALEPGLQSRAAVGDGVILVRPGVLLSERAARRLVVHEVQGHVLPRENARRGDIGLLRVGTAGGSDEEEGRALLLERRAGLFDAERQFELALRHQAGLQVRAGATFVDVVELALGVAAPLDLALSLAERALRGGGLGRELVYLPCLSRVEQAFRVEPQLEGWFERGRVSLAAARELAELGPAPRRLAA